MRLTVTAKALLAFSAASALTIDAVTGGLPWRSLRETRASMQMQVDASLQLAAHAIMAKFAPVSASARTMATILGDRHAAGDRDRAGLIQQIRIGLESFSIAVGSWFVELQGHAFVRKHHTGGR